MGEVYILMVLAIHAPRPNHGIGAYSTREEAEGARSLALQMRPDIPEGAYSIYKVRIGDPVDIRY